jgi:cell fate regulator YaaT (PSP1 superfamily)
MSENLIGIKFGDSGKTYCFTANEPDIRKGDRVVIESELGISLGRVVRLGCETEDPNMKVKPILRKATEADLRQEEENETYRNDAHRFCKERIEARELDMKLLSTEVTLDRKRYIFYFTAESRIDFRELVKDLASKFRTRIELRQIGVRDASRIIGGYGICGREFCCKSFLKTFAPISIKMAKQQDLVLNTCKLSGVCGRLMCCLSYEYEDEKTFRARKAREAEEARQAEEARRVDEERQAEEERQARQTREREEAEMRKRLEELEAAQSDAAPSGHEPVVTEKRDVSTHKKKRRRPRRGKGRGKGQGGDQQGQPKSEPRSEEAGRTQPPSQPQGQPQGQSQGEGGKKKSRRRRRRPKKKPAE